MCTARLPVVDWTDAPADLNGLVRFAERRNLVSARVPSHFKRSLPTNGHVIHAVLTPIGLPKIRVQPLFDQEHVTSSTLRLKNTVTDWPFYVTCCSLWGTNWLCTNANRTTFFALLFCLRRKEGSQCVIVQRNGFLEKAVLLEEKAQWRYNNPRHCHNYG